MVDDPIFFKIEGPIIQENFPLHVVINILECFHSIIDQSYLVLALKSRMTRIERKSFLILASKARAGSFEIDLRLVYDVATPLLPLIPQLTSSDVWQSAKAAFEFLKMLISFRRSEKEFTVSAPNNQGIIAVSSPGSAAIEITQNIFNIADRSLEDYKNITNQIEEGRIDKISALDTRREGILLTSAEKKLFNPETKVEDNPIDVNGKIFDFNTEKLTGKIRVMDDQVIPSRDYNFILIGNQDFIPYIMAMTVPKVTIRCLPEIEHHPTGAKYIYRLQAISIWNK